MTDIVTTGPEMVRRKTIVFLATDTEKSFTLRPLLAAYVFGGFIKIPNLAGKTVSLLFKDTRGNQLSAINNIADNTNSYEIDLDFAVLEEVTCTITISAAPGSTVEIELTLFTSSKKKIANVGVVDRIAFNYETTSPVALKNLTNGNTLYNLQIAIDSVFDNGYHLSVGFAGDQGAIVTQDENNPYVADIYSFELYRESAVNETLNLYIYGGSTQGNGYIYIETKN